MTSQSRAADITPREVEIKQSMGGGGGGGASKQQRRQTMTENGADRSIKFTAGGSPEDFI